MEDKKENEVIGIICAIAATFFYGLSPSITQLAFRAELSADTILFYRYFIANVFYIIRIISKSSFKVTKQQFSMLLGIGVAVTISSYSISEAYRMLPSAIATLSIMSYIIIIFIYEIIIGKERLEKRNAIYMIIAFAGIGIILDIPTSTTESIISKKGFIFGILGASFYAIKLISVNSKIFASINPEVIILYTSMPIQLLSLFLLITSNNSIIPEKPRQWFLLIFLALFNSYYATILSYYAIRNIGVTRLSMIGVYEPVISCIAGIVLLGDILSLNMIIGGIMIFFVVGKINILSSK